MTTTVTADGGGTRHRPQPARADGRQPRAASATALVVGSIIGTGVFTMPAVMAGAGTSSHHHARHRSPSVRCCSG